jgi:hypothetical protein
MHGHSLFVVCLAKKSCKASNRDASFAATSCANKAAMRERFQPSLGGGIPGSPNKACSASVWASASSTDTLKESSASSASQTASTLSSGHINRNSNINYFKGN